MGREKQNIDIAISRNLEELDFFSFDLEGYFLIP